MFLHPRGCRVLLVLAGAVAVTPLLGACAANERELAAPAAPAQVTTTTEVPTTEEPTTEAPTTEEPTTEEPATTEAPTTTEGPATTGAPTTTEVGDDEGSDVDWGLVSLIAVIGLAVLLLLWLVVAQVRKAGREHALLDRRIAHLVGGSQWVHDQASLELMSGTGSPERLRAAWADTRGRVNDLSAQASEAAITAQGDVAGELRALSVALGSLEGAIDTHVALRLEAPGREDAGAATAIAESAATVNDRRHALRAAIVPLAARV